MFFGSAMVDHTSEKLKHVAFSVIIAVAVLTALGSVIISSVSTEGFEINEATLKKGSGTDAVLLVSVKNLGNSQISDINVTIDGLDFTGTVTVDSAPYTSKDIVRVNGDTTSITTATTIESITYHVQSGLLDVGKITSIAVNISDSESLLAGSSYTITVEATAGGTVTQSATAAGVAIPGVFTTTEGTKTFQTAVVHVTRI